MVEIEGERDKAEVFMQSENLSFPIHFPQRNIPSEWLGGAIPTTIILDKDGKIAAKHEGMADYSSPQVSDFLLDLANN